MLRENVAAVEADLLRFYQIDLRDYWRRVAGRPALTLRRIKVLLRYLPDNAATSQELNGDKPLPTVDAVLLGDIWQQLAAQGAKEGTKVPRHPLLVELTAESAKNTPKAKHKKEARRKATARLVERKRAIAAGEIT